jgi:hypothetical protein
VHKAYQNILYFRSVTLERLTVKVQPLCPDFQNSQILNSISEFIQIGQEIENIKVNLSLYRPEQAVRAPGG